jgi:hypothetical protein
MEGELLPVVSPVDETLNMEGEHLPMGSPVDELHIEGELLPMV